MKILRHHLLVIESKESLEELKGNTGDKQRTAAVLAKEIVEGLKNQKPYRFLENPVNFENVFGFFQKAIEAYRRGELEVWEDFEVKRDGPCEVCRSLDCWRRKE